MEATPLKSENRCPQVSRSVEWNYSSPPPLPPIPPPTPTKPRQSLSSQVLPNGNALWKVKHRAQNQRSARGWRSVWGWHREKQSLFLHVLSLFSPRTTAFLPTPFSQQQVGAFSPRRHCSGVSAPAIPARAAAAGLGPGMGVGNPAPPPPQSPRSNFYSPGPSAEGTRDLASPSSISSLSRECLPPRGRRRGGKGAGGS